MRLSECCRSEITIKYGTEYPDGPIGITYGEEVCSRCGEPAFEIKPTCAECENCGVTGICLESKVKMNPLYKAGECKFFEWKEVQLTIGGEDIGEP